MFILSLHNCAENTRFATSVAHPASCVNSEPLQVSWALRRNLSPGDSSGLLHASPTARRLPCPSRRSVGPSLSSAPPRVPRPLSRAKPAKSVPAREDYFLQSFPRRCIQVGGEGEEPLEEALLSLLFLLHPTGSHVPEGQHPGTLPDLRSPDSGSRRVAVAFARVLCCTGCVM